MADKKDKINAVCGASSEVLFVILPFIVIAITLGHRSELKTIFSLPEWSIVSAVIVGQTIVKLVSMALVENVHKERIVVVLSFLLVCLLAPNLVVLSIVLTVENVSAVLAVAQGILFLISAAFFWLMSVVERTGLDTPS